MRRSGARSNSRAICSTRLWYLLLYRQYHAVRRRHAAYRGLNGIIAIRQRSGNLNGNLIEAGEAGGKRAAKHLCVGSSNLDRYRAAIILFAVGRNLNTGGDRWNGGPEARAP